MSHVKQRGKQLLKRPGPGRGTWAPTDPCHPRKLSTSGSFQLQPPPPLPQLLLALLEAVSSVGLRGYFGFVST